MSVTMLLCLCAALTVTFCLLALLCMSLWPMPSPALEATATLLGGSAALVLTLKIGRRRALIDDLFLEYCVASRTRDLEHELDQARAATVAKTHFLASMSHELRTPLNAVIGAAQLLRPSAGDDDQAHLINAIRQSGNNLLGLIENILDISRIESGALHLLPEDFNLFEVVEAAMSTAAVPARAKGIEVAAIVDHTLASWRHGDATHLRQIVLNLVGNAIKFTPAGEVVLRVHAGATPGAVHFSVSDTGVGIDLQATPDIFEAFRQGDNDTTRRFGGCGLGLAISKQLVRAMGGELVVQSELHKGSCFEFEIELPLSDKACEALAMPQSHRVVYFEPHEASASALSALLVRSGCAALRVRTVEELATALAARSTAAAHLRWLFLDLDNTASRAFLEDSASLVEGLQVIGMSYGDSTTAREIRAAFSFNRVLSKPVSRAAVVSCIGAVTLPASIPSPLPLPACETARHVLLVEDDPTNQTIVTLMLSRAGFQVSTASDGSQALRLLREKYFGAVLMDWQMPDMDGLETTRRVRCGDSGEAARHVPIIALTANAFGQDRAACLAAGMNDFLTKPVLATQLVKIVQRWARQA